MQRLQPDPPPERTVRHRDRLRRRSDLCTQRTSQHTRHPDVVLEYGHRRRLDRPHRHPGNQLLHRGLLDLDLAESRQHRRDVRQERPVRSDDQHTRPPQPLPVQIEQVRGPVQADSRLPGARRSLHADRVGKVGPDQFVLLRLNRGDDVAHRPDTRPLDLGGEDPTGRAELFTPIETLILETGQDPVAEPEPPPYRHTLRIPHAGLVERPRDRCPPVQHQRLAAVVGDMPTPHVVPPTVMPRTAHNRAGIPVAGPALRGAAVPGAAVRGAAVRGAALRGAALRGAALRGAALRGAALRGAALPGAAGGLRAAGLRAAGIRAAGIRAAGVRAVGVCGLGKVEAAEEQGRCRVVGQFGHPTGQGAAECLRRVRVAGHLVTGGEEGFGALPHPP
ncbi:pentapeptide repeat-containing protein [Micromonospora sp. NPDC085948]|uniref:pentapeptide repeat-containing protein n=2 Tax=unclassified Micromonospora TaxID=2617518 RepID=UPI00342E2380